MKTIRGVASGPAAGVAPEPNRLEMIGTRGDVASLAGLTRADRLQTAFFSREAPVVARDLLGRVLLSSIGGPTAAGIIVETEAYLGPEDPASHAATKVGRTSRNAAMYGPPGRAYIYRSYGVHWCFNVVTGLSGQAQAVLVRGLDPILGVEVMTRRRHGRTPIAAGPGRLSQALGITDDQYGHDLTRPPLRILEGTPLPDEEVEVTGRVGVRLAATWPLRFSVRNHPGVSRGRVREAPSGPDDEDGL